MRLPRSRTGFLVLAFLVVAGLPARGQSGVPGPLGCSWNEHLPGFVNALYPDTNANYWWLRYPAVPGTKLVVTGTYAAARFFSFQIYDADGVSLGSLYDAQINPDPRSANPFRRHVGDGEAERYKLSVQFTPTPPSPAANTLYGGNTPKGTPNALEYIMYRVYVPDDPASAQGGVPLPEITLDTTAGTVIAALTPCTTEDTGGVSAALAQDDQALNQVIASNDYPQGAPGPPVPTATAVPTWSPGLVGDYPYYGIWASSQNAYLKTTISRQYGGLVVIHADAPSFPDTRAGEPAYQKTDVRYWSMCENETSTRVLACAADFQTALQNGAYTYVVSDPGNRPSNATAANGVTWLPWGAIYPDGLLIIRNMLPGPTFTHAIQDIGPTDSPQTVMGPYYPSTVYCTKARFEQGGWQACFAGG